MCPFVSFPCTYKHLCGTYLSQLPARMTSCECRISATYSCGSGFFATTFRITQCKKWGGQSEHECNYQTAKRQLRPLKPLNTIPEVSIWFNIDIPRAFSHSKNRTKLPFPPFPAEIFRFRCHPTTGHPLHWCTTAPRDHLSFTKSCWWIKLWQNQCPVLIRCHWNKSTQCNIYGA